MKFDKESPWVTFAILAVVAITVGVWKISGHKNEGHPNESVPGALHFNPLHFEPVMEFPRLDFSEVDESHVYIKGHWLAMDKHSEFPGVSMSEISCDHKEMTCNEKRGDLIADRNSFSLDADYVGYHVTRWNTKEIVATTVDDNGICNLTNTLKFDLTDQKVYYRQDLVEPTKDLPEKARNACNAVSDRRLELREGTVFSQGNE